LALFVTAWLILRKGKARLVISTGSGTRA